jgi:hypothetical protein
VRHVTSDRHEEISLSSGSGAILGNEGRTHNRRRIIRRTCNRVGVTVIYFLSSNYDFVFEALLCNSFEEHIDDKALFSDFISLLSLLRRSDDGRCLNIQFN